MADDTAEETNVNPTRVPSKIGQKPSLFSEKMENTNWFLMECDPFFSLNPDNTIQMKKE
jgi:hypothetical protein